MAALDHSQRAPSVPSQHCGPGGPDGLLLFNLITHDLESAITQPSLQKKKFMGSKGVKFMTLKELKINLKNSLCLLSYYGILNTRTSSGEPQLYVSEPRKW